ncbi:baeRF7 domain-containing protein [Alkalibacter mobilis]|uniref:baeRF7 domain-containing protein n=1 Tax=Alkalibacter mobilis TaxID=2787712 RepID=UPI00189E0D17|nr:hypothetical protein [Alkalibacter mobilis]MBF7097411.1 hypothetical protein [Alkalibacter mobilis]
MNLLTRTEIEKLIEVQNQNCISLYFPMGQNFTDEKSKILLKNLVKSVESDLLDHNIPKKETDSLISPALELINDSDFWSNPSISAGVFLNGGNIDVIRIPFPVEPLHYIGPNYYLLPLFKLFGLENQFHILSLSQNNVRLFTCDFLSCGEVELEKIPTSLEEALKYDDFDNERQSHSRSHGSSGDGTPGVFRGQGDGRDELKTNLWRFVEMIDKDLHLYVKSKNTPVILAGVEYLTAIFKRVNTSYKILETEISGNVDNLSIQEIHQKSLPIAEKYYNSTVEKDLMRYNNLVSTDKTSSTIEDVASAAAKGKVRILFATTNSFVPGIYNPELDSAFFKEGNPDSEDLINFSVVNTLKTGGKIHILDPEKMPESKTCAALFRY